jgi:hypothetical protein
MKLTTIVLAAVLALSSTFALAYTAHHRTYHHGNHGYHGSMNSMNRTNHTVGMGRSMYGPNNGGGLVGGSDSGTYRP